MDFFGRHILALSCLVGAAPSKFYTHYQGLLAHTRRGLGVPRGCILKFLHTLEIDQSNLAHTPTGGGGVCGLFEPIKMHLFGRLYFSP